MQTSVQRIAVVTGATQGLGLAIAENFVAEGKKVVFIGRSEEKLEQLKQTFERAYSENRAMFLKVDVSDTAAIREAVGRILQEWGRIDILVYCAGINMRLPAEDYPEDVWENVLNVNLTGAFRTCQETGRVMIRQGGGSIVTVTSMMSHVVTPNQSAYTSSKGALLQYTKLMAVEWAKYNIRVNAVSPGYIITELTEEARKQQSYRDGVLSQTAMGRFGNAEEVAEGICFLASPLASFVTGACLPVDGGFLAGHPFIVARNSLE